MKRDSDDEHPPWAIPRQPLPYMQALARTVLDTPALLVVAADADGCIAVFNRAAERLTGRSRAEVVGAPWLEVLAPRAVRGWFERQVSEVRRTRRDATFQSPVRTTGGERLVRWHLHVVTETTGALSILAVGLDVSDLHRARGRSLEELLHQTATAEEAPHRGMAIGEVGEDMTLLQVDKGYATLHGYTPEDLVGRPLLDLIAPADRERAAEQLHLARETGQQSFEGMSVRKDGSTFPVLAGFSVLYDDQGRATRWLASMLDLTGWQKARAALDASESLFRSLLESAPDAMVIVGEQGRIQLVNAHAEEMFGHPRDELTGQPVEVLIPARYRDRHVSLRDAYIREPSRRPMGIGRELFALREDGTEFPVEISLSPVETPSGLIVAAAIRDISDRKRWEDELSRRTEALELANQELDSFAHVVSHDLKGPLRTISSFSQLLLDELAHQLDEDSRELLNRLDGAANHMNDLLEALGALSRVSGGDLHHEQVDLAEFAREIAERLQRDDPGRRAEFDIADRLEAEGDPRLLYDLLDNLLRNAWKYSARREVTRIEVGEEERGGRRTFFVRDNGVGFPAEKAHALFETFRRFHDAAEYEGHGIGLATVQRIVERHGGEVFAEGAPNEGATFYFRL